MLPRLGDIPRLRQRNDVSGGLFDDTEAIKL
jgi:hypothetical protein